MIYKKRRGKKSKQLEMKGASLEKYLNQICTNPYGLIMLLMKSRGEKAHGSQMQMMVKDGILVMEEAEPLQPSNRISVARTPSRIVSIDVGKSQAKKTSGKVVPDGVVNHHNHILGSYPIEEDYETDLLIKDIKVSKEPESLPKIW
jgi:hypothetical protein